MSLDKDPVVIDRKEVLADARRRRDIRAKLRSDVAEARMVLSPRYQLRKMVDRNKAKARAVLDGTTEKAKAAGPAAGVLGVGAAIFFARKPIAKWISKLRNAKKSPAGKN